MRIATWNIDRLSHKKRLAEIQQACTQARADIFILTETDIQVRPPSRYGFLTAHAAETSPEKYRTTEHRVSIFTNCQYVDVHPTYDIYTAICVELQTELGNLCVYGTIMGIEGNRRPSFKEDLQKQVEDFRRLTSEGRPLCIAGDYNTSFSDGYYFTYYGREMLSRSFRENKIRLLTADVPECIDHIAVSESFIGDADVTFEEWNLDKRLSDHKGIVVDIQPRQKTPVP